MSIFHVIIVLTTGILVWFLAWLSKPPWEEWGQLQLRPPKSLRAFSHRSWLLFALVILLHRPGPLCLFQPYCVRNSTGNHNKWELSFSLRPRLKPKPWLTFRPCLSAPFPAPLSRYEFCLLACSSPKLQKEVLPMALSPAHMIVLVAIGVGLLALRLSDKPSEDDWGQLELRALILAWFLPSVLATIRLCHSFWPSSED
jgi:hypothetical protein